MAARSPTDRWLSGPTFAAWGLRTRRAASPAAVEACSRDAHRQDRVTPSLVGQLAKRKNNPRQTGGKIRLGPNDPESKGTAEFTLGASTPRPSRLTGHIQFPADQLINTHAKAGSAKTGGRPQLGDTFQLGFPQRFSAFGPTGQAQSRSAFRASELGINDKGPPAGDRPVLLVSCSAASRCS